MQALRIAPVSAVTAAVIFSSAGSASAQMTKRSLYDRLGGYSAISEVVDEFVANVAADMKTAHAGMGVRTATSPRWCRTSSSRSTVPGAEGRAEGNCVRTAADA